MRASLIVVFALGLGGCASASAPAQRAKSAPTPCTGKPSVAIVGAHVIPMETEQLLERQTVIVCDGKVHAIGPDDTTQPPEGSRVVRADGKYLLPGLADMHTHLVREQDLTVYVARGVTTVRNMWGAPIHLSWRERIDRGELVGPKIYTAGPIIDGDPPVHDGSFIVANEDDAKRAVTLHRQASYDFIKIYSRLSKPAYDAIMAAARDAHLNVAGHVPRAVGLEQVVSSGQRSIEHLDGLSEALQRDDSPFKGKWDPESRRQKLDFLDETKLPALARRMRDRGVFNCPTRTVKQDMAGAEEVRARLARNDAAYVPPADRAIWRSAGPPDAKSLDLHRRAIAAIHEAGAKLVVGTDPGNPLVVPGFSVHDELVHMVQAGLTPYEALRAATRNAAELMSAESEFGTIAVGRRADLLLLDENPLSDVARTQRIAGVMVHGRWFSVAELAEMLADVRASFDESRPLFAGRPPLTDSGEPEFTATYRATWGGAPFGGERAWIGKKNDGTHWVIAERHDPHSGDTFRVSIESTARGETRRLTLSADGPSGRGELDVVRNGTRARLQARLTPGSNVALDAAIDENAVFSADRFIAGYVQLGPRLRALEPGKSIDLAVAEAQVGSRANLRPATWRITRLPAGKDAGELVRYAVVPGKGPPTTLTFDKKGCLRVELEVFGSTLRYERQN